MKKRVLTPKKIGAFSQSLFESEKSQATIKKYTADATAFMRYAGGKRVTKGVAVAYKQAMMKRGYAVNSVNSKLASLNALFRFLGWEECSVKSVKKQRKIFAEETEELTREEYARLITAARGDRRLSLMLQTICSTGIRVSELEYFTAEAVRKGEILIKCKGKVRQILMPARLRALLTEYCEEMRIDSGPVFRTRNGNPVARRNIWAGMKRLAQKAGVDEAKAFPHNLRKLFARTFYGYDRDLAKLADTLGHSSIETTRIYIMTKADEHRQIIDRLNLIMEKGGEIQQNIELCV